MIARWDGVQQTPQLQARDTLSYAMRRLEESRTLHCVMVIVPQAAPGRSHWTRWWPVESRMVQDHCVGRIELAFGGQHWGAYALTREARAAGTSVWVRARDPPSGVPRTSTPNYRVFLRKLHKHP